MKIKYAKWITISFLTIGIVFSSCKKYIELAPKDATYDQVFWNSGANAEKALSGAYGLLRSSIRYNPPDADGPVHFVAGDLAADEFWLDPNYFWFLQSVLPTGFNKYSNTPYLEPGVKDWTRFYAVINQCHLVVENTEKIPVEKFENGQAFKNQIIGEGRFLRAYTYFYITRIWGDPVLTKESLKDPLSVQPLPRSKEEDVLNYCIEDLKVAAQLLDFNIGTATSKIRADKGAVWALLAHVYAWKHDYANAGKYCDSVIKSGNYSLQDISTYEQIWAGQSVESIFELNMLYNAVNNEANDNFFGRFLHDPLIRSKPAYTSWLVNTNLAYQIYDTAVDKRFSKTIGLIQTGDPILIKYTNVKYFDPTNLPDAFVVNNNLVLLRLADIYLLKAEAASKQGNDGAALQALNVVKVRAGLAPSTNIGATLFDEILEERYRELYGEGCLAYDLIRMGMLQQWLPGSYIPERIAKKGYYWPLDMRKLLPQDPFLTQNEWWKNH